ncbi:serine acetyltransferase 1, chloroplastic-like [Typha angustifolia]|uniref:serine acetyltransferase 1, chloroplastic-like n=1 Tax=Typha angustifolia TaxID=59011 RepID=UPI003C30472E
MATCVENCRIKAMLNCPSFNPTRSKLEANSFFTFCDAAIDEEEEEVVEDEVWAELQEEARSDVEHEVILQKYYFDVVLSHHSLESALSAHLASKLAIPFVMPSSVLQGLFYSTFVKDVEIQRAVRADLRAARDRDPACAKMVHCFLYYKGFLALEAHRVAHRAWVERRMAVALLLQSRVSEVFAVDIHPGARIGEGVLLDHATGVVIGETAVVGDNVSLLHNVTLGGTGKTGGDRHPKIGKGVLVGAGTQILGNVRIGEGAKVGAGSVVLKEVPERTTAVGNPAKLVGGMDNPVRMEGMAGLIMEQTSWSDYKKGGV